MANKTIEQVVEDLVNKAGKAEKANEAMAFSHAACNAANANRVLIDATLAAGSK